MNPNPEQGQSEGELTQLLQAFLGDPSSPGAVRGWYAEIAKRCPLWTLQYFYYLNNQIQDLSREYSPLVEDLSFRLMARPSRDEPALRTFARSNLWNRLQKAHHQMRERHSHSLRCRKPTVSIS